MKENPEFVEIPLSGPVDAVVQPPGSKSITNRALVCAALAEGESLLTGVLDSEDTQVMMEALRRLGVRVEHDPERREARVVGCGGKIPARSADLYLANSGTSLRFLTAVCSLGRGRFRLDGNARMRERPIQDLVEALNRLGVKAWTEYGNGCPPVIVEAAGLSGGSTEIAGEISSQFVSGLLMAAPYAAADVELIIRGDLVSKPYVDMTLEVMRAFGVDGSNSHYQRLHVAAGQRYQGRAYAIEPDASAATYFFAAAAVTGGRVTVTGLSWNSLQGDVAFCRCLEQMGCEVTAADDRLTVTGKPLRGISVDMNAISDTVPTLGVVALFAEGPTEIRGVRHIRFKETDRIAALATELRRLGAEVEEFEDGLRIVPQLGYQSAAIHTYNDHRMAMSFAIAGLRIPGVKILDPGCTAKTYPRFFEDLFAILRPA
ncbi:MAG: 3-phosphoshikimate 1-carboxyvinyltransferase [Thermogutta sp.]|uniref:3-phosphoshikimate 1-carboxyvinyltransferase n=1 Tax=Thermogutta sp. TaxID=1962930 RepID=UPI00199B77AB|nr:3-phosphoshikimate 1-carboxyvinyltransferase [Thermogutta sp.]MBC7353098.1 3-phosphoshikimate 1-carboxyvinyltransferase [Thermogutta sp.]